MATPTYELIETTTLASAASSVTFSSITQDYRDLVLAVEVSGQNDFEQISLRMNGSSSAIYSEVTMGAESNGAIVSQSGTNQTAIDLTMFFLGSGQSGIFQISVMDYSATDKHKSVLARYSSAPREGVQATAGRYANTNAVNSLSLISGGQFDSGSTFALYGIAS